MEIEKISYDMNLIQMTIHTLGPAGTFTEEIALRVER